LGCPPDVSSICDQSPGPQRQRFCQMFYSGNRRLACPHVTNHSYPSPLLSLPPPPPRQEHGGIWCRHLRHSMCNLMHLYTHTHTHTHTSMHTYIHTHVYTNIQTYIHTYIRIYIHTYIHTYLLTYIHTYIHTYMHIETYIHTYRGIHTCMCVGGGVRAGGDGSGYSMFNIYASTYI
jgi:hypothetical protein